MEDLPPGYRFYPTEEELVHFYLRRKVDGMRPDLNRIMDRVIPTLDIYEFDPWDLPQFSGEACQGDSEQWFFFIPRKEREARGGRPKRLTSFGYWKATGSPGYVYSSSNRVVGHKRTMVFYKGRAPNGNKTDWKMNEYKVLRGGCRDSSHNSSIISQEQLREEYSLCRVYKKSKNLRSFDRRPTTDGASLNHQLPGQGFNAEDLGSEEIPKILSDHDDDDDHPHHQCHQMTCDYSINPPVLEVQDQTILIDSSSSDSCLSTVEIGRIDQMGDSGDDEVMMLTIDDVDPFWDWINN